jgi:hypothetical protein
MADLAESSSIEVIEPNLDGQNAEEQPKKSKRQIRRERKWASKVEHRKLKRTREKERRKQKRQAIRESGNIELLKRPKIYNMASSKCPISVAIDMSYQQVNMI